MSDRLHQLVAAMPGAAALLRGPELVVETVNPAWRELIGGHAVVGEPLGDTPPAAGDGALLDILRRCIATGAPCRGEAVAIGDVGDGRRLVDIDCQPIASADRADIDLFVQVGDVTARAAAELALRENEERLQLAFDPSTGIGVWDWDVTADRLTADTHVAGPAGSAPDAAGRAASFDALLAAIHPDDLPRVRAAVEATLREGVGFAEEYRLLVDGEVHWVAAQGRARFDAAARAMRLSGISLDITKRKEAETRAQVAAADLRLAVEAQAFVFRLAGRLRTLADPDAILELSTGVIGGRLAADRVGFYRVLPGEQAHFLHCWTSERLPPLTGTMPLADFGERNVQRYAAGETLAFDDYRREPALSDAPIGRLSAAGVGVPLRRGGHWAATLFVNQAMPRHWTADEITLIEAVAEITWDAVERANAVAGLRESEEKFRAIANSIDQMVWSTLPDGYHDYYNERWYEFTGVPHGSTDGEAWNDIFHPDDQDRAWAAWRHSLATGDPYRIEYRLRHHSGEYRWVLGSAQAVHDEGGRIRRWFGTCTDIQEIVSAREVLARSRAELEAAVLQRTEQLMSAEEQLRQAQKMEAVGQLTGGIAHDFNNMLAVVIGALDLLDRRVAQGRTDVGRYVEAARDGANRAAALTQRLLSFSRQSPLAPVAIDMNAMIAGMTELLSRTIGESVVIETRLDERLWPATADPSQLENAIVNLAVNARDAMPRGGRLTIETGNAAIDAADGARRGIPAGDYARIAVGDTGSGMDESVAAKAFDPFFTTKTVGKGTGLGLSQVFGFVRQSGGHVEIATAPGRGTTVSILLPRDPGVAIAAPPPPRSADAVGSPGEIILVVEDEERVRHYSVEALRELGYTVVHADSGAAALAMIDAGQVAHLLFTDVVMPEMTGRELADMACARLPDLRVLYTSGYTREAVGGDMLAGVPVLRKPFDVATLGARVRATLNAPAAGTP